MLKSELFKKVIISIVNADTKGKQSSFTETVIGVCDARFLLSIAHVLTQCDSSKSL